MFAPGRVLLWAGEPAETVFRIVSGFVRLERYLPDGRRLVASFPGAGDTIGLCAPDVYRFTAVALTRVLVQRTTRRAFFAAARTPEARADLIDRLAAESCALNEELLVLLHERAEQRLAHFLLSLAERAFRPIPAEPVVHLPMSRADIADHLGLTVETVCRSLSRMRAQGVVAVPDPSRIVIRRPQLLRALCRESPGESAGAER
ncbi:helix-turn-helix domain-containing protein [Salinarimonas sp. NSM]|uniref:helix-turn-helix domain-containing protein n=1 Tax=Salinarimonas sp. NSM TaxID=3458003 RepID=UPI0040366F9B